MQARSKKKARTDEQVLAAVSKLLEKQARDGRSPTVKDLAMRVGVRRARLSAILKQNGLLTRGQRQRVARSTDRLQSLPRLELVGVHAQGATGHRKKTGLCRSTLVAFVFASRGFPRLKEPVRRRDSDGILAPSPASSDRTRIARFEVVWSQLLGALDDPSSCKLDPASLLEEVQRSLKIGEAGYSTHVFLHATGQGQSLLAGIEAKIKGAGEKVVWDRRIEQLLAAVASIRGIACLGPGHFPLMESTVQRMQQALGTHAPGHCFNLRWSAGLIDQVVQARLAVADAIFDAGALMAAPQARLGVMGRRIETRMGYANLKRPAIYTDGAGAREVGNTRSTVGLAVPAILPQTLYTKLDARTWRKREPFIGIETTRYKDGKDVETLVAWLPDLWDRLASRCSRQKRLDALHEKLVGAQEGALRRLPDSPHSACYPLIDPKGFIRLPKTGFVSAAGKTQERRLGLGMVLTTYDSDMIVSWLLDEKDREVCLRHQMRWLELVVLTLEQSANKSRIVRKAGGRFAHTEETLNRYLQHVKMTGNRLVRFLIEQAAADFSLCLVRAARRLRIDGSQWPEQGVTRNALPVILEETRDYWPVAALRVDHLLQHAASQVRKRLCCDWKKGGHKRAFDERTEPDGFDSWEDGPEEYQEEDGREDKWD